MQKNTSFGHRKTQRVANRRDRRARKRVERQQRKAAFYQELSRETVAIRHADRDTEREAISIANEHGGDQSALRGWRDDLAWRRHFDAAYQWTSGWTQTQLEAEILRLQERYSIRQYPPDGVAGRKEELIKEDGFLTVEAVWVRIREIHGGDFGAWLGDSDEEEDADVIEA